jgi:uncharacterized protein
LSVHNILDAALSACKEKLNLRWFTRTFGPRAPYSGIVVSMYEERFYRGITRPSDLLCYEVRHKETDLLCCTEVEMGGYIQDRVVFYRHQLEEYIKVKPFFKESLSPVESDLFAPVIAQEMIRVSGEIGVGPMATVAGAIAEFVGNDISNRTRQFIIENGGDVYLRTIQERTVLIYAKDSPYSQKIGIRLRGRPEPYGVCTSSGTVGHSLSFGQADAVCIMGSSALLADGLATYVGNIVKKKDDIPAAIEKGKVFPGVTGILIIVGESLGAWGDVEIVTV